MTESLLLLILFAILWPEMIAALFGLAVIVVSVFFGLVLAGFAIKSAPVLLQDPNLGGPVAIIACFVLLFFLGVKLADWLDRFERKSWRRFLVTRAIYAVVVCGGPFILVALFHH